ncbi:hypothetical protein ON010_g9409 [Phytophthora cinnamomi]|nr:hypothetical protein ON010_g9409 [Phytophthora cinnamomi]
MWASEVASHSEVKESEVQQGESAPSAASRPSVSASGSRGAFSCRRWRLLSGKPSKDDATLDNRDSMHKPSLVVTEAVQRPTTANVDSKDWASAATPFAAFLPRDTIVPTISRKSVAAVVLTSAWPPENTTQWDREMTICERKHVKAMGRMATRIYRGRGVGEDPSEPSRRRKNREKQALKDQIYLPVLCHARAGGSRDLTPRVSKSAQASPVREISTQGTENAIELPTALAGMKLLSSQLDELRAGLDAPSRQTERLAQCMRAYCRPIQTSRICRIGPPDSGSSSSSLETLLLRVLERPPACPDGYQADQEASTVDSSDGTTTNSLDSRSTNPSEDDLLFLLNALDSTSQASSQDDFSGRLGLANSVTTSELTASGDRK